MKIWQTKNISENPFQDSEKDLRSYVKSKYVEDGHGLLVADGVFVFLRHTRIFIFFFVRIIVIVMAQFRRFGRRTEKQIHFNNEHFQNSG